MTPLQSDTAKETIRSRIDISTVVGRYVALKQAGGKLKGLCPFHKEKTPSFTVDPSLGLYYCFGCHAGGDVFKFVMEIESLTFPETLRVLGEEVGVEVVQGGDRTAEQTGEKQRISKTVLLKLHSEAVSFYYAKMKKTEKAIAYLKQRGLSGETVRDFRIGYAPDQWSAFSTHALQRGFTKEALVASGIAIGKSESGRVYDRFRDRIVFPLFDGSKRVVGFGGRTLTPDGIPKYLNSPETLLYRKSSFLYGFHTAREAVKEENRILVVEGYMDVLSLYQHGIRNGVATSGTALTPEHGRLLERFAREIVLVFDGDTAGRTAARRAVLTLAPVKPVVKVLVLPPETDPDSFVREQGREVVIRHIAEARDGFDFLFDECAREYDRASAAGKSRIVEAISPYLNGLTDDIIRRERIKTLAESLRISEAVINRSIRPALRGRKASSDHRPESSPMPTGNEFRLLQLCMAFPHLISSVREHITPQHLIEPVYVDLFSQLIQRAESGRSLHEQYNYSDNPETQRIVSRLLLEDHHIDNPEEEMAHTIRMLKIRFFKDRINAITLQLKKGEGLKKNLLEEHRRLSQTLQELYRSHG